MTIGEALSAVVISTSLVAILVITKPAFATDPIYVDAQIVEFDSVPYTYPASPFKVKQSQKLGIPLEVNIEPSVSLFGYLARPADDEPRAAVLLLHTCAGISEHEEMWSKRLVDWGYVVLSVDSFKPRGFDYICDSRKGASTTAWRRALDAYGAKRYLSTLDFVDPDRIAVIGMSHGGMTVMETIKQSISEGLEMDPFRAAIALYPLCSQAEPIITPTLILVGSEDSWTPAVLCEQYLQKLQSQIDIRLKIFADSHHAFDHPGIDTIDAGYVIRSNLQAAAAASEMARQFLEEHL